jgi:hypothetical protein
MTGLEALSLLRNGNVKVKRAGWGKKEYLESYSCDEITGIADIYMILQNIKPKEEKSAIILVML